MPSRTVSLVLICFVLVWSVIANARPDPLKLREHPPNLGLTFYEFLLQEHYRPEANAGDRTRDADQAARLRHQRFADIEFLQRTPLGQMRVREALTLDEEEAQKLAYVFAPPVGESETFAGWATVVHYVKRLGLDFSFPEPALDLFEREPDHPLFARLEGVASLDPDVVRFLNRYRIYGVPDFVMRRTELIALVNAPATLYGRLMDRYNLWVPPRVLARTMVQIESDIGSSIETQAAVRALRNPVDAPEPCQDLLVRFL